MCEYDLQMAAIRDPDPDVQLHQTARDGPSPGPLTARTVAPHSAPGKCWLEWHSAAAGDLTAATEAAQPTAPTWRVGRWRRRTNAKWSRP